MKQHVRTHPSIKLFPSEASLVLDEYEIVPDSTAVYYQAVKRKLAYSFYEGYNLYIKGKDSASSHLLCHPFIGTYDVESVNDSTFLLRGSGSWPTTGEWEDGFTQQEFFSLELVINDEGWRFPQLTLLELNLQPTQSNIEALRRLLDEEVDCSSKDWDKAVNCFPLIKQYEFALFTAITTGDTSRIDEYLSLQSNFDLAYAGEFSEYYTGNIYYLLARGILTPQRLNTNTVFRRDFWIRTVYGHGE